VALEVRALAAMSTSVEARRHRPYGVAAVVSAICAVAASTAHAAEGALDEGVHEPAAHREHSEYHNALVLKIAHVDKRTIVAPAREAGEEGAALEEGGAERHSALGITLERVLVEGWLNAEVGTLLSSKPGGRVAFPSTVLLKVPAEVAEAVEAYLGAGLAVELEHEERWVPNWGAAGAIGLYVWIAPETGFTVDFEQSFFLSEGVIAELSLGAGVVTRF
jgi:hypothetical protein